MSFAEIIKTSFVIIILYADQLLTYATSLISFPSRHFISSTLFSSFATLGGKILGLFTLLKPNDIFLGSISRLLRKMPLTNVYKHKPNS